MFINAFTAYLETAHQFVYILGNMDWCSIHGIFTSLFAQTLAPP